MRLRSTKWVTLKDIVQSISDVASFSTQSSNRKNKLRDFVRLNVSDKIVELKNDDRWNRLFGAIVSRERFTAENLVSKKSLVSLDISQSKEKYIMYKQRKKKEWALGKNETMIICKRFEKKKSNVTSTQINTEKIPPIHDPSLVRIYTYLYLMMRTWEIPTNSRSKPWHDIYILIFYDPTFCRNLAIGRWGDEKSVLLSSSWAKRGCPLSRRICEIEAALARLTLIASELVE